MRLPLGEARDVVDRLGASISVGVHEPCVVQNAEIARDMFQACGWPACRKNLFSFGSHFFHSGITPTNGVMAAASQ
jgi:hypothetical protein